VFVVLIRNGNLQLLNPAGYIADTQSTILWGFLVFVAIVGAIMISAFLIVAFRYKEGTTRTYKPEWTADKVVGIVGWGVPLLAIIGISIMIWITAHQVDPYRPITAAAKPITIQVVALQWKWLFIYPNERIATVNMLEIPVGVPINFSLTAEAPMNSFWIPRLGGQVYAMTGMVTQLHLKADKIGTYAGSSAEISGDGFSGMDFTVKAVSAHDYNTWVAGATATQHSLDRTSYAQLARPSSYNQQALYKLTDPDLFNEIVMETMMPSGSTAQTKEVSTQ
jgi:cytochrome o ubiquinol oxidase subunit 2